MIKITCTSCQKPLSLDETKLPMREVTFPCPACRTKLTVDRRNLELANAAPRSAPDSEPAEEAPQETHDDEAGFGAKALIVGNDHPGLRQAAKFVGFAPVHLPEARAARDYFMQEFPPVVMLNPPQVTPPPLESMQPIVSLTPLDRRKAFLILFADNLRTLDGNAAFLYGVNLVVSMKDLAVFPQIYREAVAYHERLYGAMRGVMQELSSH